MKKMTLMALLICLVLALVSQAAPSGLIGSWVLAPERVKGSALSAIHGTDGAINGPVQFVDGPFGKSLVFDGTSNRIELYKGSPSGTTLPAREITIEAWAKIETRVSWTGILNYVQDNGAYERGFFLGVVDGRLGGYVSSVRDGSEPRYDWIYWDSYFELGRWYHIAFTYDGANMKLYIDGALVRESSQAYGDIAYPEQSTLAIGAFMDDNELEHIKGAIREVRLYSRALSADEIKASVPGQLEAALPSVPGGTAGTAAVIVVLKDGTTLSGILIKVEGEEIILFRGPAGQARIKFDSILAVLPSGK